MNVALQPVECRAYFSFPGTQCRFSQTSSHHIKPAEGNKYGLFNNIIVNVTSSPTTKDTLTAAILGKLQAANNFSAKGCCAEPDYLQISQARHRK